MDPEIILEDLLSQQPQQCWNGVATQSQRIRQKPDFRLNKGHDKVAFNTNQCADVEQIDSFTVIPGEKEYAEEDLWKCEQPED